MARRYTIGLHGAWTGEAARKKARALLGQFAQAGNPAEERRLDAKAITVKEFCTQYLKDAENGLVLGKRTVVLPVRRKNADVRTREYLIRQRGASPGWSRHGHTTMPLTVRATQFVRVRIETACKDQQPAPRLRVQVVFRSSG